MLVSMMFFERGSDDVALAGEFRLVAVGEQSLVAQRGERERGLGAAREQSAFLAVRAAGKSRVDVAEGLDVGSRFEVGGKSVAHAGHEEAYGRLGDDAGVDEDHAGALFEVSIVVKRAVRSVEHCGVGRGRVGRRDGGADDERFALGDALRGVDSLAAAEAYGAGALVFFGKLLQTRDFLTGTLAREVCGDEYVYLFERRSCRVCPARARRRPCGR